MKFYFLCIYRFSYVSFRLSVYIITMAAYEGDDAHLMVLN